mgnify:CR=1 FL=1|jgi:hypothetical protein
MGLFKKMFGESTVHETIDLQRKLLDSLPEILGDIESEFWDGVADAVEEIRQDESGDVEDRLMTFGAVLQHLTTYMGNEAQVRIEKKRAEILAEFSGTESIDLSKVTLQ